MKRSFLAVLVLLALAGNALSQTSFKRGDDNVNVSTDNPLPVEIRQPDVDLIGTYEISQITGALTAGAATKLIFYARWTHATNLAVISEVSFEGMHATTAFAAGAITPTLHIARSFTAENATPGGTNINPVANGNKLRTSQEPSGFTAMRISTTAVLGAPTWTLDTNPVGVINTHSSAGPGAATPIIGSIYLPTTKLFKAGPGEDPIVLTANEGVAVQVVVPATGVWIGAVRMKWKEVRRF